MDEALVGGQEQHERRGLGLGAQILNGLIQRFGDMGHAGVALVAGFGRTGSVRRQFQDQGRAGKLLSPEGHVPLQPGSGQPFLVPGREVGILNGQRLQQGLFAMQQLAVAGGQLLEEDAHRPAVRDDVVFVNQHDMPFFFNGEDEETTEWFARKIEGFAHLGVNGLHGKGLVFHLSGLDGVGVQGEPIQHEHGLPVLFGEAGTQGLVAFNHHAIGLLQGVQVQRSVDGEGQVNAVSKGVGFNAL